MAGDPREEALRLAWRLCALPEAAMRSAILAETFRDRPAADVVALLPELVGGARTRPGLPFSEAVTALAAALDDSVVLGYELRSALYAAAKQAGRDEIARLFFAAAAGPGDVPGEPEAGRSLPRGAGGAKTLTLGERKSLARGGRTHLLQHLMRDPDAQVIRILLGNPRLTERDVVFIAARRPVRGDVLKAVFRSRWVARYHVRRALVMNPYTPSDLAVRLVPTLSIPDLRAVAGDPHLGDPVRAQAEALLTRSMAGRGGRGEE